ncbi:MAG TPA: hypothetical protein PLM79_01370 [Syntrophobacteraceae bacterium]|nr:hypothetical protein [Syntrophobacteraceae bacterium]
MPDLSRIPLCSQYLGTLLRARPELRQWLSSPGNLHRRYGLTDLFQDLERTARSAPSFEGLLRTFREFKQRHFLRIGARDLLGMANLAETTGQLSDLATVCLQVGLDVLDQSPQWWADKEESRAWATWRGRLGLVVLGLGKLGGHELNYVSDVDLLYLYSHEGMEEALPDSIPVLVQRLFQWLGKLLSDHVDGDRVFETDLRLRPGGKDGPLVPSLSGAADHYLQHGRPWERQMLLKARPVAGNRSLGTAFLQEVRPFVFRRFLDFQALDEIRAMRDRILSEAPRPRSDWENFDVKLGVGGIREVEFLVQSLQLIYGGRHPELEEPNSLRSLQALRDLGLLSDSVAESLAQSYSFLRRIEHFIQLDQNRHSSRIPRSPESLLRICRAAGIGENVRDLFDRLQEHCRRVHEHFLDLFRSRDPHPRESITDGGEGSRDFPAAYPREARDRLEAHLRDFPADLHNALVRFLRPYGALRETEIREKILLRIERYLAHVRRRPGLTKVFHAFAPWMEEFFSGLGRSELLGELLAHNPSLVEGMATTHGAFPPGPVWERNAARVLDRGLDYEQEMEWIRRLKNERTVQIAREDLAGRLSDLELELELSGLADFVVRHTYGGVCRNLGLPRDLPLAVLGLGKLGSREMSYLSDLDLVFVYRPAPGESDDEIPGTVLRLVQRFMRMLSTPLQEGPGYAVDVRLRPTGNYGPLIVTERSWIEYYSRDADLWEIQALLRLRTIAGNPSVGRDIEGTASRICYGKRDESRVWARLCHLRQRMQEERAGEHPDLLDLKLGNGGLADVEFLVQGLHLARGHEKVFPAGGSVRSCLKSVLTSIGSGESECREVMVAFKALRALEHRLRLYSNAAGSKISPRQLHEMRALGLWPVKDAEESLENWQDLLRMRKTLRKALGAFCPSLV